jgi:hypothetical protein
MGKKGKKTWGWDPYPEELPEQHPFQNNPFVEGLFQWMDSPEGELTSEVSDVVWQVLQSVTVDAAHRKLVWPDGKQLSIDESVLRIHADCPQYPKERIESHLISWLEMGYAPESYSQRQLDELDRLTERWVKDHDRRRRRR